MPDINKLPPTQEHLNIEKIRDNLIVLKDGTVSLVLKTTAVNFDLLSEPEQDSKIMAFGQLLNSLPHSFQIYIRTKKVNIRNYLSYIKSFQGKQLSPGLKRQISIYLNFVQNLIVRNEVLDKSFYIIIPFRAGIVAKTNPVKQMFGKTEKITNVERIVEQAKAYLYPKRDHIMKQLIRMGLNSHQLNTKELLELFFEIYNPDSPITKQKNSVLMESQDIIATRYKENIENGSKQPKSKT